MILTWVEQTLFTPPRTFQFGVWNTVPESNALSSYSMEKFVLESCALQASDSNKPIRPTHLGHLLGSLSLWLLLLWLLPPAAASNCCVFAVLNASSSLTRSTSCWQTNQHIFAWLTSKLLYLQVTPNVKQKKGIKPGPICPLEVVIFWEIIIFLKFSHESPRLWAKITYYSLFTLGAIIYSNPKQDRILQNPTKIVIISSFSVSFWGLQPSICSFRFLPIYIGKNMYAPEIKHGLLENPPFSLWISPAINFHYTSMGISGS